MHAELNGTTWPLDQAEQDALVDALARAQVIESTGTWPGAGKVAEARQNLLNAMTFGRIPQVVSREAARAFLKKYNIPTLPKSEDFAAKWSPNTPTAQG